MLVTKEYDRGRAYEYAERWALSRNPLFFDYTGIGGNCTNFVSQALFAGGCVMNFTPIYGWYYLSPNERTASWTGVDYFRDFLVENRGEGPFAREVGPDGLNIGDVIQLGRQDVGYYHTLLVVGYASDGYLVAAQSDDAFDRPLSSYQYDFARYLHIEGIRFEIQFEGEDCYEGLLNGTSIFEEGAEIPALPETPVPSEPGPDCRGEMSAQPPALPPQQQQPQPQQPPMQEQPPQETP